MISKRKLPGGNEWVEILPKSKRRTTFPDAVKEVMKLQSLEELFQQLEPYLRRVVKEEVELSLLRYIHSSPRAAMHQIQSSVKGHLQLRFKNKLFHTLFTNSKIEAEDGSPIEIFICDSNFKVFSSLPELKVEILVLDGNFGSDKREDWSKEEFDSNIICEREGKRPLLIGSLEITLNNGVGKINFIAFTDNSSWTRSRKFRLGARVSKGSSTDERIREAISGAFIVKDHRGESYKKHYPPSLNDEVFRLEKIGKDGKFHDRLLAHGISTVQDFLRSFIMDQESLRNICGMSNKTWEQTVNHARTCDVGDKRYVYYSNNQNAGLLLNSIFEVIGVIFEGCKILSLEKFNAAEMIFVENLKKDAYRERSNIIHLHGRSMDVDLCDPVTINETLAHVPSSIPNAHIQEPLQHMEDITKMQSYHSVQPLASTSINRSELSNLAYNSYKHNMHRSYLGRPVSTIVPQVLHETIENRLSFPISSTYAGLNSFFPVGDEGIHTQFWPELPEFLIQNTRNQKASRSWFKLIAALKWRMLAKKKAANRKAMFLQNISWFA